MLQVGKLTLSNFKPKRIANLPDNENKIFLGTLVGRATAVVTRKMPNDDVFYGLSGMFEAHIEGDAEPVQTGVLFMPDSFINPLIEMLSDKTDSKTGEVLEAAADAVSLAYRVYAIKAGNPQGYSWQIESIVDPTAEKAPDPLENMRKLLAQSSQPALEDKSGDKKKK